MQGVCDDFHHSNKSLPHHARHFLFCFFEVALEHHALPGKLVFLLFIHCNGRNFHSCSSDHAADLVDLSLVPSRLDSLFPPARMLNAPVGVLDQSKKAERFSVCAGSRLFVVLQLAARHCNGPNCNCATNHDICS